MLPKYYRFKKETPFNCEPYWYTTNWGWLVAGSLSHDYDEALKIYNRICSGETDTNKTIFSKLKR